MIRMAVRMAVLVIVFAGSNWLLADDAKKDPPSVKRTLPPGFNKLGLSEQQKQKVFATRAEYRTKIDELRKQIQDLEAKERGELQTILTDAQKARLKEVLAEKPPKDGKKPESKPETKPVEPKKP
jgi:hypothetical protein